MKSGEARPLTAHIFGEFSHLIAHYQKSELAHLIAHFQKNEFAHLTPHLPLIFRSFSTHFPLIFSDVFRQFFKKSNAPEFALMT